MNKDLDFIQYGKLIMCLDNNGSTIFQFINYDEKIEDVLKKIDDEGIYKVISIFDVSNRYSQWIRYRKHLCSTTRSSNPKQSGFGRS